MKLTIITLMSQRCQYFAKQTHILTINETKMGSLEISKKIKLFWYRHKVVIKYGDMVNFDAYRSQFFHKFFNILIKY